jgi:hypothetical protein
MSDALKQLLTHHSLLITHHFCYPSSISRKQEQGWKRFKMAVSEHDVEIATGRRDGDGHVRLFIFAEQMLALTVEGHGERAPTLLLTLEQARKLQAALSELIPRVEEAGRREQETALAEWDGAERRQAK